jgi:hypothetical protein
MESFHTSESRASDALLNGSLSENDVDDTVLSDEALRSARISEYQHESLHDDDSLVASFGALTSGILKIAQRYEQGCIKLMDDGATHDSPELQRAMDTFSKLSRQAERNVNLMTRLAEDQRRCANIKSQRRQAAMPGSFPESSRRNKR